MISNYDLKQHSVFQYIGLTQYQVRFQTSDMYILWMFIRNSSKTIQKGRHGFVVDNSMFMYSLGEFAGVRKAVNAGEYTQMFDSLT